VQIGVLQHAGLVVEKITGDRALPMLSQVGGRMPAQCSAVSVTGPSGVAQADRAGPAMRLGAAAATRAYALR